MDDMSKAAIAVGALAIAGIGGYAIYKHMSSTVPTSTVTTTVASLELTANPTAVAPGGEVTFTATPLDSNGNPVSNVPVVLNELTTNTTSGTVISDNNGQADFSVTFPSDTAPGNYVFQAEVS